MIKIWHKCKQSGFSTLSTFGGFSVFSPICISSRFAVICCLKICPHLRHFGTETCEHVKYLYCDTSPDAVSCEYCSISDAVNAELGDSF